MKGDAQPLIKFFDGSDKRFIIPLYQRNYDWKIENCEQLFRDLMDLHHSGRKSHFFGSIVSCIESGSEDRFIIDGQQRITTVSLLLIAMVNAAKNSELSFTDPKLVEKIFKRYLVDEYQEDERKVKLKPIKKDMQAFDALLYQPKEKYLHGSNVTRNYDYFYDEIKKSGLTMDELFDSIKKLEVINIRLDDDDDPQLIFESLNSTGLDLSEADKIRNYLLMSLSPSQQDDLYTRFWNPIEENTDYEPSAFVRDYLTMKNGTIGRIDKIYFIFKEYAENSPLDRAALLEEMDHFARIYKQLNDANMGNDKLNRKLCQLRTLDLTVAYPFYLALFDYARKEGIDENEQYRLMDIVEAYLARRIICSLPSNALNKVFATLHREVCNRLSKADDGSSYVDVLTYVLLNKGRSSAFPTDVDVKRDFATRQVYRLPSNQRMFILERLENRDNNERHEVVKQLTDKTITIEHIMPQTLSEKWKQALGDEWERIHGQYLHTMANLTLTGYNSQYSNLSFIDKRDMEKGFKDSAFRLNNYVKSCDKWTEDELINRQEELLNVFMHLWPMPTSSYNPPIAVSETAALDDDDFDFAGRKLQGYRFRDVPHTVNTWKEMLVQICTFVAQEKRSTVEWLCANEKYGFSASTETYRRQIGNGMFVWSDSSTMSKISVLRSLFDECNIPQSDLVFEFRPEGEYDDEEYFEKLDELIAEGKESEATKIRYAARYEFWKKFIADCKESGHFFADLRPTASTGNGFSFKGIPGAFINGVINKDNSRVEIYIDNGDYDKNKEVFDLLHEHVQEIEAITGPLDWQRLDAKRASRICVTILKSHKKPEDQDAICQFFKDMTVKFRFAFEKQISLFN